MHQEIADRQAREPHDAVGDAGEVERDRRFVQRLGQEGGRGMIGADADAHKKAKGYPILKVGGTIEIAQAMDM
jgi:hypothetical protein